MHSVWSVMAETQPGGPYGAGGSGYPQVPAGERDEQRPLLREAQA
jgi:hypothetical protein